MSIRKLQYLNMFLKSNQVKGVIFDMDGTLTKPVMDFSLLRKQLKMPDDSMDILHYVDEITDVKKRENCMKTIEMFEEDANKNLELQPNIFSLFKFLKSSNIPTALITRNNRRGVDAFIERFIEQDKSNTFQREADIFSIVLTRDFTPVKPDPAAALHVCNQWNIPTCSVLFVGDDIKDIQCGNNAGNVSVLKTTSIESGKNNNNGGVQLEADMCIEDLNELIPFISSEL